MTQPSSRGEPQKHFRSSAFTTGIKRLLRKLGVKAEGERLSDTQFRALSALKCQIGYNKYGAYCLPESSLHRTATRKVLSGEVYEPQTIAFMRQNCAGGDIIHAGTYFGDFLPGLAQACSPNTKIWAFEPNPENFRCAQVTVLINGLDNITLTNAGLGSQQGKLAIRTKDESGRGLGGKSRIVDPGELDPTFFQDTEIVAIDSIVERTRPVSIIQLDVEGFEEAALSGALHTIQENLPILILEIGRKSQLLDNTWFSANILGLGYKPTGTLHSNTVFECGG